jgi:hypothetical protein
MTRFVFLLIIYLLLAISLTTQALALNCSSPPSGFGNSWWSQYASWCSACGGSPDVSTTSCTPGPNWGGSGSTNTSSQGLYRTGDLAFDTSMYLMEQTLPVFFEAIGNELACQIDPNCPRKVRQRQIEEQQRLEREARQRVAEEERKRQELERRARFEQTKQNLLGEMRLQPGSGDLRPRSLTLETREVAGTLQARPLVPRELDSTRNLGAASLRSPLAQASCGAFLLRKANDAASRGDFQEASFLSNEAAALIGGEKITSAVTCPPPPAVPDIGPGIEAKVSRQKGLEIKAALEKRSRYVRSMYQRVVQQGKEYQQVEDTVRKAEERKRQALASLEQASTEKDELESLLEQTPPPASESVAVAEEPKSQSEPAKESAMAAALAALEAAETAYKEADSELQNTLEKKDKLQGQMQETRSLFDSVKKDPNNLDKALETMARSQETH